LPQERKIAVVFEALESRNSFDSLSPKAKSGAGA
jgi:hypothetical protein